MTTLTVHMIGNAHIDPVWLWPWQRGSDEVLATCRSACDLLDEYPEAIFTRGEAWAYEQVRALDPDLLKRIQGHIKAGRWDVTGGWWVQSDTNLPTAEGLRKNIALGQAWFRAHLGITDLPVAYLVDSFGHSSYLPRILNEQGQRFFVMMRPGPHEKELPSSLFRWRSPDGAEVLTFRIIDGYGCLGPQGDGLRKHIERALAGAPQAIGHVMCFYGVGDHGGGPTRAAVEWIRAQREFAPGVRLEFSSSARFFAAVESQREQCPVVVGELEPHAIGCYSVCGDLKREVRAAELGLQDAATLIQRHGVGGLAARTGEIETIARIVSFNQFHDIITGSSIREAIQAQRAQVGEARSRTDALVHTVLRKESGLARNCALPGQRVHVVNRLDRPWSGLVEGELWTDFAKWNHHLIDEDGAVVPAQCVKSAAMTPWTADCIPHVLFPLDLAPLEHRVLRLMPGRKDTPLPGQDPRFEELSLDNGCLRVTLGRWGVMQVNDIARGSGWALLAAPLTLECSADDSDTWSHGIERFSGPVIGTAEFEPPLLVENGLLRTTVRMAGHIGTSRVMLFVSLVRGEKVVYLRLDASYQERQTVLKAVLAPHFGVRQRQDRVAGGWQERAGDGKEYALHHAVRTESPMLGALGMVLPDTFALDGHPGAVRPTLIRNSINAYDQCPPADMRSHPRFMERFGTDEGPQSIRLALTVGEAATPESMERILDCQQRAPHLWEDFRGVSRVHRLE